MTTELVEGLHRALNEVKADGEARESSSSTGAGRGSAPGSTSAATARRPTPGAGLAAGRPRRPAVRARSLNSYLTMELSGRHDRFFVVELERGSIGKLADVEVTETPGGPYVRSTTITGGFRLSAQWGKRIGWFDYRFGLKESTFGVGADADPARRPPPVRRRHLRRELLDRAAPEAGGRARGLPLGVRVRRHRRRPRPARRAAHRPLAGRRPPRRTITPA